MESRKNNHLLTISFGVLILQSFITSTNAATYDKNRYALPSTMVNITVCQKKALLLYPGTIKGFRSIHRNGTFLFQYRITQKDGMDVLVVCDGENGNIIPEKPN